MPSSPSLRAALFSALLVAPLLGACGKQAEGERCDVNSGNLDCDVGLVCRSSDQLSITGTGVALCCPPDDVNTTVNACRAGAQLPDDPDQPEQPAPVIDAGAADGGS